MKKLCKVLDIAEASSIISKQASVLPKVNLDFFRKAYKVV